MKAILDELSKARIRLLLDHPVFGHIILHLEPVIDTRCPTAATDGKRLIINPDFFGDLTREQQVFLCAHEVLHCALDDIFRRGKRDKDLWNMCADLIVNDVLIKSRIGKMIQGGLHDPLYSSDDYTVEELYDLLEKEAVKIQLPLDVHLDGDGGEGDDGEDSSWQPNYSEAEKQAITDNIRSALIQGVQQQEGMQPGSTPAGILRMLERLLRPQVNWREMLDHLVRTVVRYDYSYMRMSRRFWSTGLVLPGSDVMERV